MLDRNLTADFNDAFGRQLHKVAQLRGIAFHEPSPLLLMRIAYLMQVAPATSEGRAIGCLGS
jgi:hypothetical protein